MEQRNDSGDLKDLILYRIESAKEDLKAAVILRDEKIYKAANNRAYYAIYHALSAVHCMDGNAYKRHKDAIANFNKAYVKTGIFPREIGKRISEIEEIRHASDYNDFYIASLEEVDEAINTAQEFIDMVEKYCKKD